MWLEFVCALLLFILFLYGPGMILLKAVRLPTFLSIACAPLLTIALYALLGVIYGFAGVPATVWSLPVMLMAFGILAYVLMRATKRDAVCNDECRAILSSRMVLFEAMFYVLFSMVLLWFFWLRALPDASALIYGYDTVFHVNLARGFANTSDMSILHSSLYADASFYEGSTNAFYPAGWHILVALILSGTSIDLSVIVNASNYAIAAIVFPLSMLFFMRTIFVNEPRTVLCGSVVTLAAFAFPWLVILKGEQFAQLLSFSLLPLAMGCVVLFLTRGLGRSFRIHMACLIVCSLVAFAASQPNAVFTLALFALVYVLGIVSHSDLAWLQRCSRFSALRGLTVHKVQFVIAVVAILLWTALYLAPFMQRVVTFTWPATRTFTSALGRTILGGMECDQLQVVFAIAVFVGLLASWRKGRAWLGGLLLIVLAMYVVDISTEGFLKHFLCGFWYTDPSRIAAMAAIFAIPLASFGLSTLSRLLAKGLWHLHVPQRRREGLAVSIVVALFVLGNYGAYYLFPGCDTPFHYFRQQVLAQVDDDAQVILESREKDFADRARALIPEGSLIVNVSPDGSAFLYGLKDLNLYYRRGAEERDSETSVLLNGSLNELAWNDEVRKIVEEKGIEYVLLLDHPQDADGVKTVFHTYSEEKWRGLESITEETPGFDLILHDDDMYLYRIE